MWSRGPALLRAKPVSGSAANSICVAVVRTVATVGRNRRGRRLWAQAQPKISTRVSDVTRRDTVSSAYGLS